MLEGPGADSEEKREPVSNIDTAPMKGLKALDPNRPIGEADICDANGNVRYRPIADIDPSLTGRCDGLRLRLRPTPSLIRVRQVRAADRL